MSEAVPQHGPRAHTGVPAWTPRAAPAPTIPRTRLTRNAGFMLLVLVPAIMCAEIGLRFVYFPAPPRPYRPEAGTNGGYHALLQQVDRVNFDGEWVRAYRGRAFSRAKSATIRIVCLGGSTTWGHHLETERTWPFLLEESLRQRGFDAEVINAGRPWYTTVHSITNYATQMRYYHPDVVIVMHGVNDLARSFPAPHEPPPEWDYGSYQGPMRNVLSGYRENCRRADHWTLDPFALLRSTAMYRLAFERRGSAAVLDRPLNRADFPTLEPFRAHLDYLTQLLLDDHRAVVLATQAHIYERSDVEALPHFDKTMRETYMKTESGAAAAAVSIRSAMRVIRETTLDVARRHGTRVADVMQAVGSDAQYYVDDFHLNATGNAVAADAIADVVSPVLDELCRDDRQVMRRPTPNGSWIAGHDRSDAE